MRATCERWLASQPVFGGSPPLVSARAGVGDDARNEHLAFRDLDALKEVVLVLVPRIGGLEAVRPRVDLQYVVDNLWQACFVEPRPLVEAVARVEAHPLTRNPLDRSVGCVDIKVGAPLHLLLGKARLVKDVR